MLHTSNKGFEFLTPTREQSWHVEGTGAVPASDEDGEGLAEASRRQHDKPELADRPRAELYCSRNEVRLPSRSRRIYTSGVIFCLVRWAADAGAGAEFIAAATALTVEYFSESFSRIQSCGTNETPSLLRT